MYKQWVGCCPSNFQTGRSGFAPEAIVLHGSHRSLSVIDVLCGTPKTYNSVHYAIGAGGEIHQYVEEKDTAYQAGIVVNPAWKQIKRGKNPNFYTIGIEQEKGESGQTTEAQYAVLAELLPEIAQRWKFTLDADHVVMHDEIRAGAACPGRGFDRSKLLNLLPANGRTSSARAVPGADVLVLRNANVREEPRSSSRVVRLAKANTAEDILGFVDSGERVSGNSIWYQTADGFYFWAGVTDKPNPTSIAVSPAAIPVSKIPPANGLACGIACVDDLLTQINAPRIGQGTEAAAIGAIQDLLTGHGFAGLPTVLSSSYGLWTTKTASVVQAFQKENNLPITDAVDKPALEKMIGTPAVDARASHAYLALVLNYEFTGLKKILSLVAQMEGAGKFAALNRNTDRAGLSFGLIQWAQKPGRLAEVVGAMSTADRATFVTIFGVGDPNVADGLLAHCRKPFGGIDSQTGRSMNAAFNLVEEPWTSRFQQAAMWPVYQQVQVQLALNSFTKSCTSIRQYAPDLTSERAMGFMLDVANQFGDAGARRLYSAAHGSGPRELDILEAIADESVRAMDDSLKAGVRARRDRFVETSFLLDNRAFGA